MEFSATPPKRSTRCYEVHVGHVTLLFSYCTLVAVSCEGEVWRAPRGAYSKTTGRHINESGFGNGQYASPAELHSIAAAEIAAGITAEVTAKLLV